MGNDAKRIERMKRQMYTFLKSEKEPKTKAIKEKGEIQVTNVKFADTQYEVFVGQGDTVIAFNIDGEHELRDFLHIVLKSKDLEVKFRTAS